MFLTKRYSMKAQKIALTGILAAIICLLAPLSIPAGTIPISLATFAVYITACTVNIKHSVSAVIIYILLGAAGLPVFSAFRGGFNMLIGITGGYLFGYIPCALIIGLLTGKYESKKYIYPVSIILGSAVCYSIGTIWYMLQTKSSFYAAFAVCVLPFIIGEAIKIFAASAIGFTLRKRLLQFSKIK